MKDSLAESLPDLVSKWQDRINEFRRAGDPVRLLSAAEAGVDEIGRRARECLDHTDREALRAVKRFTYNASADCWPGWSAPKTPSDPQVLERALGLAERSAELVKKLGLGPLQEGTGAWLCGAHELALGRYTKAYGNFTLARQRFLTAQAQGLALLAEGYLAILCRIAGEQVPAWPEDLDRVCARISAGAFEDGAAWIEQLRTAHQAFTSRCDAGWLGRNA